jgi:polysaccharide biosynthesis protein PslH
MIAANCEPPISNWAAPSCPCCIFHGALDDDASVNALTWFCRRVWPELTRRLPQAIFVIGGRGSRHRVQELGVIPGVILACSVLEESTYFSAAAIALFPSRYACTAQEEVLHALAMRKAVIATPAALDGLELQSGVHVRTVNTASDWIAVTYHLMLHPEVCAELGKAGGDWAEQKQRCKLQHQQPATARLPDGLVRHPAHSRHFPHVFPPSASTRKRRSE